MAQSARSGRGRAAPSAAVRNAHFLLAMPEPAVSVAFFDFSFALAASFCFWSRCLDFGDRSPIFTSTGLARPSSSKCASRAPATHREPYRREILLSRVIAQPPLRRPANDDVPAQHPAHSATSLPTLRPLWVDLALRLGVTLEQARLRAATTWQPAVLFVRTGVLRTMRRPAESASSRSLAQRPMATERLHRSNELRRQRAREASHGAPLCGTRCSPTHVARALRYSNPHQSAVQ